MIPINYTSQNVRTCEQWRAYSRVYRIPRHSVMAAARHYARQHGKAIIFHADDSATIIAASARNRSGLSVHKLKPDAVSWHSDAAQWQAGWAAFGKGMLCPDTFPRDYRKGYYAARAYYLDSIERAAA